MRRLCLWLVVSVGALPELQALFAAVERSDAQPLALVRQ
jgi:hypothetical protein